MLTRPLTVPIVLLLLGLLPACVPRPTQSYTIEQIPQIPSLKEVMRVQAGTMDPLFKKRGQTSFTPAEFTTLAEAGRRIEATSAAVRDKFAAGRPPGFATFAGQLNGQAADLSAAAQAQDAAKTSAALRAMKETCRGCHKEFR